MFVIIDYEKTERICKIINIFKLNDSFYFLIQFYTCEYFEEHFHAYVVNETNNFDVQNISIIRHYNPLSLNQTHSQEDEKYYLRTGILCNL